MSNDKAVSEHYLHGDLLKAIQAAISELGKTIDSITIEDLAPVDEFHIGGRVATESFHDRVNPLPHDLAVFCRLEQPARRALAHEYVAVW